MQASSFVTRARKIVVGLASSPRRVWWTSFVLVSLLCGIWGLANAPFAGPDEPAHVVRSIAVAHGEATGTRTTRPLPKPFRPVAGSTRRVEVPEIFGSVVVPCFAHHRDELSPCLKFEGPTAKTDVPTYTAESPPVYYAVAGVMSWVHGSSLATVYLLRFVTALLTAAFVATAIAALRRLADPPLVALGVLLAVPPTVLFLGGTVSPSAVEIAASVAVWTGGLVLVARADEPDDARRVTGLGISATALVLTRQLGPLWLALIALALVGLADPGRLRALARSRPARRWGAVVLLAVLVQLVWDGAFRPVDASLVELASAHRSVGDVLQDSLGATSTWFRQMIGDFGWLDTNAPIVTWLAWVTVAGFVLFLALAWTRRRDVLVLLGVLGAVVAVPVVIQSTLDNHAGTVWQGRYSLPIAVGVPLVATFALSATERGRELTTRRFVWVVGVLLGVGHILAFAQNLRRYTKGATKDVWYFLHADWEPPVPALFLTVAYVVVAAAFVAWVLLVGQRRRRRSQTGASAARDEPRISPTAPL